MVSKLFGYNNGRAKAPAEPHKAGYISRGWYDGEDEWIFTTVVTRDMTLKAMFRKVVFVTFDADNGTAPEIKTYLEDEYVAQPATPVKVGFTFGGWYSDDEQWDFEKDALTKDITLKAEWE